MHTESEQEFLYGIHRLTPKKALALVSGQLTGVLSPEAKGELERGHDFVVKMAAGKKSVYGVNTGFGPLCRTVISPQDTRKLQENILRSHSVGVGEAIPKEVAKLMLVLKVQALSFGYSGVAPETVERILWHVKEDVIPVVPAQGSLGASGDLAPLAHLFLPLIGLGEVSVDGRPQPAGAVLSRFGLEPLTLGPKEGLALINGTQFITAYATGIVQSFYNCLEAADIIGALSLEAMLGSVKPFQEKLHALRPFPGAQLVAHRLTTLLKDSELIASHAGCARVQDPYSLRCMPQVHGASRDAWLHLNEKLAIELNAVTDNPVIFGEDEAISGGLFHGQHLALPLDYCALAASELGNISERRTYLLLEGKEGLPLLLMKDTGINSGFMLAQYTAAALVSENKAHCFPASADSIPTSLGQEDHVSLGSVSALKTQRIVKNLENILAVELLCAAQAVDFRRPLKSSKILEACHDLVRKRIAHAEGDRVFSQDIEAARQIIASGELVETANEAARALQRDLNGEFGKMFQIS